MTSKSFAVSMAVSMTQLASIYMLTVSGGAIFVKNSAEGLVSPIQCCKVSYPPTAASKLNYREPEIRKTS